MLTISTAALPLGLLVYHLYLIWAGTTTSESQKWSDWREDMEDGYGFIASRATIKQRAQSVKSTDTTSADARMAKSLGLHGNSDAEPHIQWPLSDQILVRTEDGMPPSGQEQLWRRVRSLADIDNIYDLGATKNLLEVIHGR